MARKGMHYALVVVATLLALCSRHAVASSAVASSSGATGYSEIRGKVYGPSLASTHVILYQADGQQRVAPLASDSSFTFANVPPGSHLLHAFHVSAYFPEMQIEVGKSGVYRATFLAQGQQGQTVVQQAPVPLAVRYLGDMTYFEKRKPVDVWSFVKSPYGLMIVFSLFMIVVMPRMKVDPEELKQFQNELKGGSSSSAAGAASGQRAISNR